MNLLGNTGLEISAIGIGGHEYRWLQAGNIKDNKQLQFNPMRKDVIQHAIESGINFFDTTFPEEVQSLGHVLKQLDSANNVVINGMIIDPVNRSKEMSTDERINFIDKEITTRLKYLNRDYFDIFMVCAIDHGYDYDRILEILEIYKRYQNKGHFRFVGVSCHLHETLLEFLKHDPKIDCVMFPYNYAVTKNIHGLYNAFPDLMSACSQKNIGTIAIKPLCWTLYGIPFTAAISENISIPELISNNFSWHVQRGFTDTTVVGVETVEELQEILSGLDKPCDSTLFDSYFQSCTSLDVLLKRAPFHSKEIQARILQIASKALQCNLGNSIDAYKEKLLSIGKDINLPKFRIL